MTGQLEPCVRCDDPSALMLNVHQWGDVWLCYSCVEYVIEFLIDEVQDWSDDERVREMTRELEIPL